MDHTVIIYGQNNGHEMASVFQFDHFLNVNNPPDSHQIGYAPPHMPLQTYAQPHVCSTLYMHTTIVPFGALRAPLVVELAELLYIYGFSSSSSSGFLDNLWISSKLSTYHNQWLKVPDNLFPMT